MIAGGGELIFTGMVARAGTYNIAPILDALSTTLPGPIFNPEASSIYRVKFLDEYLKGVKTDRDEFSLLCIKGGLPRQHLAKLAGQDPFAHRFLPGPHNFLLTTRTNGWDIRLKRSEAMPMLFINESVDFGNDPRCFEIVDEETKERLKWLDASLGSIIGFCALNLEQYTGFDRIGIYISDRFAFQITFEDSEPAPEHHLVRYRNSLGAFEQLELAGRGEIVMSPAADDGNAYNVYDPLTGGFIRQSRQLQAGMAYKLPTGFISPHRVNAFMDMLVSEEVYLVDANGDLIAVRPSVEEFARHIRHDEPLQFDITFTPVYNEDRIFPTLESLAVGRHLFSKQFDIRFA